MSGVNGPDIGGVGDLGLVRRPTRAETWKSITQPDAGDAGDAGPAISTNKDGYIPISREAVRERWSNHVKTLSKEQRQLFKDNANADLTKYAEDVYQIIDARLKSSKVVRATDWIQPLVGFMEMCKPLTDGLNEIYPPAGAIFGGVFFALSVTKRVVKYQEALVQFLDTVMGDLASLDKFKRAFPDVPEIQKSLVDVFDIILQICVRASEIFVDVKGKNRSSAKLFFKSFDNDFGEWKETLTTRIKTFDKTIQLVSALEIGYLHETQLEGLRMQHETYEAVRRSEIKRTQEERERRILQMEQDQDEKRPHLLAWLSSLSFQKAHNGILATTLNETARWLLRDEIYTSWKARSEGELLWVYGKNGSGKSHMAAQVVEELKKLCTESNKMSSEEDIPPAELATSHLSLAPHSNDIVPEVTVGHTSASANLLVDIGPENNTASDADHIQKNTGRTALAYIYCSSQLVQGSERWRTGDGIDSLIGYDTTALLSSLLRQLYRYLPRDQDVAPLHDLYFETNHEQPSREDITKGIKSVIPMFSQAFIVIDGLDECKVLADAEFEALCKFLAGLARLAESASSANVLIFSRPGYQAISSATKGSPSIEVDQGGNAEDIRRFIRDRSDTLKADSESLKEIQTHLLDSADGMFLWASLAIDSIRKERTPRKMKAAAKNVPKGLSGVYLEALKRVVRKDTSVRDLALKALLWVTNSKKPLSEAQLLEALAIEPGMTSIEDDERPDGTQLTTDCEDMLVLSDGNYELLHSSLGDFLRELPTSDLGDLQIYREMQARASQTLAEDCITYIKFDAFASGPASTEGAFNGLVKRHPFLQYAGLFWGDHLREALDQDTPELKSLAHDLLRRQHTCELLHQLHNKARDLGGSDMLFLHQLHNKARDLGGSDMLFSHQLHNKARGLGGSDMLFPFPPGTTPLHLLSIFGLQSLLDAFVPAELDIDQADGLGFYAVAYAAIFGRKAMFSWIVAKHLDQHRESNSEIHTRCNSNTWLMGYVVQYHWTDIIPSLLSLGHSVAEISLRGMTALHMAARWGYTDMVEQFLNSGADPDMRDGWGYTPLMTAAYFRQTEVVEELLRRCADASCQGVDGVTALHYAANADSPEMVTALLRKKVDLEARWVDKTPLHIAAFHGSSIVIDLLVTFGANLESATGHGDTALILAAGEGRVDATDSLLRNGASITATDCNLNTALHWAAWEGRDKVLSLLLGTPTGKTMVNKKNDEGQTPLWDVVDDGNIASAIVLLDNGAQVDSEDNEGQTPVQGALSRGHLPLAAILFDKYDANPTHIDHNGATSLHMIAKSGRHEYISRLLACGVEAMARDHSGWRALHYAVERGHAQFVESFTKVVPATDMLEGIKTDESLVHTASRKGYHEIVKLLIKWKTELALVRDENKNLPLHVAVASGHIQCVEHLCDSKTINLPGANGRTALHYAVHNHNSVLAELLVNHGADVNSGQSQRLCNPPLIDALLEENYEIVNTLLDLKADVEAVDDNGWRALHFAAFDGRTSLARRLLDSGCEPEPLSNAGETPYFLALGQNHTAIVDLLWVESLHNATAQLSHSGATYAHLSATRGRLDILEQIVGLDRSVLFKIDLDGDDPLTVAVNADEYAVVDFLLRSGMAPDGTNVCQKTPLTLAAVNGSINMVTLLLKMGAKVDQPGPYSRTALSWAVHQRRLKTAHELLQAGANPHVKDAMGVSAFDLAVGCRPMMTLLDPWLGHPRSLSRDPEDRAYSLAGFISRTARSLALMSEMETKSYYAYPLAGRRPLLRMLRRALLMLGLLVPVTSPQDNESYSNCTLSVASTSSGFSGGRTSVPVRRAEVFKEWRFLHTDADVEPQCSVCERDIKNNRKYYVCATCHYYRCHRCCSPLAAGIPLYQHLGPLQELRQLERTMAFVMHVLRGLAYRDARVLRRVLCQDEMLKRWVRLKKQEYRSWQGDQSWYSHFRKSDFVGWTAVHIMARSQDLDMDGSETDNVSGEETRVSWSDLTRCWQDLHCWHYVTDQCDPSLLCTHRDFLEVTRKHVDSEDDYAVLDSSGIVSFEVFEAMASKYDAVYNGTLSIGEIQSRRLSDWLQVPEDRRPDTDWLLRHSTIRSDKIQSRRLSDWLRVSKDHRSNTDWLLGHSTIGLDNASESAGSKEDKSTVSNASSSSAALTEATGTGDEADLEFEFEIEEIFDNLLAKFKSLPSDAPEREETELVLETAWKMAQAIAYHDTPRQSLREIAEQKTGTDTAPGAPATSDFNTGGSDGSSEYATAKSISLVSFILESEYPGSE